MTAARRERLASRGRVAGVAAVALTLGFFFITSILGAYHAPAPQAGRPRT
jgi:hypothetical protein